MLKNSFINFLFLFIDYNEWIKKMSYVVTLYQEILRFMFVIFWLFYLFRLKGLWFVLSKEIFFFNGTCIIFLCMRLRHLENFNNLLCGFSINCNTFHVVVVLLGKLKKEKKKKTRPLHKKLNFRDFFFFCFYCDCAS